MSSGGSKLFPVEAKRWLTLLRMASLADRGRGHTETVEFSTRLEVEGPKSVIGGV